MATTSSETKSRSFPLWAKIALGLFVIVLLILLALPYFLNVDRYRDTIANAIAKATGRKVVVGPIHARLFPGVGVTVGELHIGNPPDFPNCRGPRAVGEKILEYAIYHSPLSFIRTLLEIGADPNPADHAGFPPLIAALACSHPRSGSPGRSDTLDIIKLLLMFDADPNQRGINDYTPLHLAVGERQLPAIEVLLEAGADPRLRTRIDDYETPREMAERAGLVEITKLLAACELRLEK